MESGIPAHQPASGQDGTMRMTPEQPNFLSELIQTINTHGLAAAMALVLSWLRIQYDDKEPKLVRRLLEACLGGVAVLAIGKSFEALGISSGWTYAAAGFIGVAGVDFVRELAKKWAQRKSDNA